AGLNFGAGVELISHLQVGINYGLGLTDNYSAEKYDLNAKNRGWSVTAAILF
ncbi:MAG: PorT family protein, partial [Parabacteroides sp.]|nr:PorT family protein [Parabacteroides sp.]